MLRKAIPLSYLDDPIRQCSAAPAKPLAADFRSFDVKSENSSLAVTLFGAVCVGAGTALLIARIFIFTVQCTCASWALTLAGERKVRIKSC